MFVDTFTDGLLGPDVADARPGRRRRPHRVELDAGLLGPDDHARDPRRARGLHAGRGRGRRGRRRDRDPHQGHRGHLDGDLVGQRPGDGGPLQRRPVLRRRSAPAAAPSGRRRGSRASARPRCAAPPAAPTRRRSRSPTATRSRSTASSALTVDEARAEELARDAARAAALPDNSIQNPILTFAPHDIVGARHAHAAVPRPARHVAVDDDPRLPQRGRLRRVPGRRAAQVRARRAGAAAAQDRRPPGHRRRARRRDPRLPGQGRRAAASTSATCTRCRATARSPATPRTSPARSRCRSRSIKGLGIDGPVLFPLAEDLPFLAKPLTAEERARAQALAAREGVTRDRGVAADLGRSAPARTSTRPPTTACAAPPSCSA